MVEVTSHYRGPLALPRHAPISPGQTVTVDDWDKIKDHAHVKTLIEKGVIVVSGEVAEAAPDAPVDGYAVQTKSPGWFVITFDGAPVTKGLRKDDLADFDSMSDEDKAAFVDLHKPQD